MDDVENCFAVRVQPPFSRILDRDRRADKDFAQMVFVDGEGDAVGRSRILKKPLVDFADLLFGDEIDRNFFVGNFKIVKSSHNKSPYRALAYLEIFLTIIDRDSH